MEIFTSNQDTLTIHIRLTKKCNADCSYCSSFERKTSELMHLDQLSESLDFLITKIKKHNIGGSRKHLTVQYIGGEISLLKTEYLHTFVSTVKAKLSPLFSSYQHGVQSNLIASQKKLKDISHIFDSNIGTSYDFSTGQRTINNNSKKYNTIFLKNITTVKKLIGKEPDGIIVLDQFMLPHIHNEIKIAEKHKRNLIVRPVFLGGSSQISPLSLDDIEKSFINIYKSWILNSNIIIDPFYSFLQKRIYTKNKNIEQLIQISGCPSQHNCATSSLNIEPDGSLYTCLDMADSKKLLFGNILSKEWNDEIFNSIYLRSQKLQKDCYECDYFKECQGGCMHEAILHTNNIYGKTEYCSVWKILFSLIDQTIETHGTQKLQTWIDSLKY